MEKKTRKLFQRETINQADEMRLSYLLKVLNILSIVSKVAFDISHLIIAVSEYETGMLHCRIWWGQEIHGNRTWVWPKEQKNVPQGEVSKEYKSGTKEGGSCFSTKRDSRNLQTNEYASNLCQYLDQSSCVTNLTMCDLRNVLTGLNGVIGESRANVIQEMSASSEEANVDL